MPLGHVAFRNGDPVAGRPLRWRVRPIHLVDEAAAVPPLQLDLVGERPVLHGVRRCSDERVRDPGASLGNVGFRIEGAFTDC